MSAVVTLTKALQQLNLCSTQFCDIDELVDRGITLIKTASNQGRGMHSHVNTKNAQIVDAAVMDPEQLCLTLLDDDAALDMF